MTVFETMQEEELKILSPLFFITDSWVRAVALYKPLDSSWSRNGAGGGHSSGAYCLPLSTGWLSENRSHLSIPPKSVSVFFIQLQWAEKAKILASNNTRQSILICLSENRRVIEFSEALLGLPKWLSGKESACQCRRRRRQEFDPWVGKSPWRRKWLPTLAFLPWLSHGQSNLEGYSLWGGKESVMTEQLSMHAHMIPQSSSNR